MSGIKMRKIKYGDSKEKLIEIYGHPNFVVSNHVEDELVYRYSNQE